ncbi:MAG: hypothetical protein QM811_00345 [Pirellulales bacterium]
MSTSFARSRSVVAGRWSLCAALVVVFACGAVTMRLSAKDDAPAEVAPEKPKRNPFVPRDNLDAEELFDYIDRMMDAPRSVKNQEEFGPGMYVCAERLLTKKPTDSMCAYAEIVKLDALHLVAQFENQDYQNRLVALAKTSANDPDKSVAARCQVLSP